MPQRVSPSHDRWAEGQRSPQREPLLQLAFKAFPTLDLRPLQEHFLASFWVLDSVESGLPQPGGLMVKAGPSVSATQSRHLGGRPETPVNHTLPVAFVNTRLLCTISKQNVPLFNGICSPVAGFPCWGPNPHMQVA